MNKQLGISAIVLVAVIMGMSALAPAISSNLATDSFLTENTILPSAWANCHQANEDPGPGDGDPGDSDVEGDNCPGEVGPGNQNED